MQLIINIEKKHFVMLIVAISFLGLFMLGQAADVDINDAWHPLQQIAKSESDTTSVDSDNNNQIDWADNASYAYGIEWNDIDSRPSGLDDGDQYLPDNPATSDVDMSGNVITNLADPNNPQDGATKNYVDSNDGLECDFEGEINLNTENIDSRECDYCCGGGTTCSASDWGDTGCREYKIEEIYIECSDGRTTELKTRTYWSDYCVCIGDCE